MEMYPEKTGSVLRPGVINIVGETHSDSSKYRDLEKDFVREVLGNDAGYWTETDFPDEQWQPHSMTRKLRAQKEKKGAQTADLMELRGPQAAVALVGAFVDLCAAAKAVGARTDDDDNMARAAVTAFVGENLDVFVQIMARLKNTWKATDPKDVPESGRAQYIKVEAAVQTAWDDIRELLVKFQLKMLSAKSPRERLEACRIMGEGADLGPLWLRPLSTAVGAAETVDPEALEQEIDDKRSMSMALGAVLLSGKSGVYKVGGQHIKDLTTGRVKVDASRTRIVSEEGFNREFKAWLEQSLGEVRSKLTDE